MNNKLTSQAEMITPAIAEAYLLHNVNNRNVNKATVNFYAEQMQKGLWMLNGATIQFDTKGNLIDGQHRLLAIIKSQISCEILVCRNVNAEAFYTIDKGKIRSTADNFQINGVTNATEVSAIIRSYLLMYQSPALVFGNGGLGSHAQKVTDKEILDFYDSMPVFWTELAKYTMRLRNKYSFLTASKVGGVIAYLHLDKKHELPKVELFFDLLYEYAEHPEYNDGKCPSCIKLLRQKLISCSTGRTHAIGSYKLAIVAKVWNCFIKDKELKVIKILDGEEVSFI